MNWREADAELNYRRFFAVNTLAAVRVEDPEVFDESHVEIRRWFDEGLVDGLRVDHPDGLRDPGRYLDDLAALTGGAYVLVEKILEPGETLPRRLGDAGHHRLRRARARSTGCSPTPPAQAPLDALETRLRGGDRRLAPTWSTTPSARSPTASCTPRSGGSPASCDRATPAGGAPEDAVAELLACFPVYRSYLPDGREHLDAAFAARPRAPPRPRRDVRRARAGAVGPVDRSPRGASSRPAAW